jgi:hypothetical protein
MIIEQGENKGRPEQLVIPPDWQIEPVQPPAGSIFCQAEILTPERVEKVLAVKPRECPRILDIVRIENENDILFQTAQKRNIILNSRLYANGPYPPHFSTFVCNSLFSSRETQLVTLTNGEVYLGEVINKKNPRLASEFLGANSLIARQLMVAQYERGISFLCRSRNPQSTYFVGALEIPGGTLELIEEGKNFLSALKRKYMKSESYISETFDSAMAREFAEEFGSLNPVLETREGAFVTYVINPSGKIAFLEVTDLVVLDSFLLETLKKIGNHYRTSKENLEEEWQIRDIDSVLQEGQPMLPTFYAVLSRFKGQYVYEYEGWQIYGEYIPYNQSYFATRGKEIKI